jgi:DNA-binding SARP family transcriptional activator
MSCVWYHRYASVAQRGGTATTVSTAHAVPEDVEAGSVAFRILGPLEVTHGTDVIDLGPAKQRALLAILLCRANSVVPTSDLVETLWPDGQPRSALKNIQGYACGLRKAVVNGGGFSLLCKAPGYQVSLGRAVLDAVEFDSMVRRGRSSLRFGDPGDAARLLRAALDLWRGPALAEFSANPVLRNEAGRLTARRIEAYESLIEAQLALGSVTNILDEVEELARAYPVRERLRSLQMAALHQVGRQAEAFAVYDEVRQKLAGELGISPSPVLDQQYQAMLAHQPGSRNGAGSPVAPMLWLPRAISDFVGRRKELGELLRVLGRPSDAPTVAVVHGLPGVGKTALAVHVAHRLRSTYPDGQILVRFRDRETGWRAPGAVFVELLRRLGVDHKVDVAHEEDRAALLRALLVDRRVLLVLDDATDARTVHPLLPGTGGNAALVTSRRLLALDSAHYVGLDPFTVPEAAELLGQIVGTARVDADPEAAEQVLRAARLLPLAVRVAATMLVARPDVPLRSSSVDGQAEATVRAVVAELLDDLDADERRMLGRLAGLATRTGVGSIAGWPGCAADGVEPVAERLLRAHAMTDAGADHEPRYRIAELLAPYVGELVASKRD